MEPKNKHSGDDEQMNGDMLPCMLQSLDESELNFDTFHHAFDNSAVETNNLTSENASENVTRSDPESSNAKWKEVTLFSYFRL